MILLVIVRRCFCEVGHHSFDLEHGEDPPEKCRVCGSVDWEEAPEVRDAIYIRRGISKAKRRLNPGAASRKRQQQGKRQYQSFKPRPVDIEEKPP